jgi:hypothetical protein
MKIIWTIILVVFWFAVSAQSYTFPNIGKPEAEQIRKSIDTAFEGIARGNIAAESVTGKQKELTREMLNYLKPQLSDGISHEIINCYPLDPHLYRVMIALNKDDTLRQVFTIDVTLMKGQATIDLPLWYDTRNWSTKQIGTIRYRYDHDFKLKAAKDFDKANKRISGKLDLHPDSLDFYLSDNYQQIMQWLSISYSRQIAGLTRDGFNTEQTIFAIQHNEDFSHDLVHFYVFKVRKGPRNGYAEEGVAYYWGNAYYPDVTGQMIELRRLKTDLRDYLVSHPDTDLLRVFRQTQRGLFGPVPEISPRSTMSAIIAEQIEKDHGVNGILQLLNCGAGESNYFSVTQSLAGIDTANFDIRVRKLLY